MATDFFLKIDGVEGESTDEKLKGYIEVTSWSWGATNGSNLGTSANQGGGRERVNMQDFHFVAEYSAASETLKKMVSSGKHIPKAVLICRKAGGEQEPYLTFEMSPVLVSSYQVGASAHGDSYPTDQFSLNYGSIKSEYKGQKNEGGVANKGNFGWNLQTNKEIA